MAIWEAKRSCSSSSLTTPSPFVSAAPSAENWSSSSCQVGIRIGHSFSSERSDEVVDVLLEVLAQLGPLLGQVVVLAGGQRRDEQDDEHGDADHREVGEPGAERPRDVARLQPGDDRVEQEHDGARRGSAAAR